MTTDPRNNPERIPDELIDALLDGELDSASKRQLFSELAQDPERCERVAREQRMISMLREPIDAPDLSATILARVHGRRRFLPAPSRRLVRIGRLAAAACVLLTLLGVAAVQRWSPEWARWSPRPAPVTTLVESSQADASAGVKSVAEAVERIGITLPADRPTIITRLSPGSVAVNMKQYHFTTPSAKVVQIGGGDPFDGLTTARVVRRRGLLPTSLADGTASMAASSGVIHFPLASQGSRVLFLPPPQRTEELGSVLIRFGPSSFQKIVGPSVY